VGRTTVALGTVTEFSGTVTVTGTAMKVTETETRRATVTSGEAAATAIRRR
jgi:hypothetical protein